ncbi:MAG: NADH-quinone reductase [Desulfobacteraceae bacterium]|nr:NADH-quinone reductase [Desulfobacteraceae bacterium]
MEKVNIFKGFKTRLKGEPDLSIIKLPKPSTIAVSALDIPFIRPRILVKDGDKVKIGSPLFYDKQNPDIQYLCPGAGVVQKIVFGARRRLHEVVVQLFEKEYHVEFESLTKKALGTADTQKIIDILIKGGLWQCLRRLPARDTADPKIQPPLIIVCLNENDMFAPHPGLYLENETSFFELGLSLLRKISKRVVVAARKNHLEKLAPLNTNITHVIPDLYPAWNPGAILFHIKKTADENNAWYVTGQHLLLMVKLILTGHYPIERIATVSRENDKKPHLLIRQGMPVKSLAPSLGKNDLITSGMFSGRIIAPDSHMGFFENTLNILKIKNEEEFLGFIRPGTAKTTVSNTFLSCLFDKPGQADCDTHGEERACINCACCHRICPNDLMPNFIMKALHGDDLEDALDMGLLDCCNCGLCSYTCPCKIELAHIFQDAMNAYHKDKE